MADLIGQTLLNRYRVDSLLGHGGMGDVYKVWDSQRGVFLAMKVLHADLAEDKVFLRRFAREAETLSALQHPHIVRFYGLEQEGRLTFMLMDYVEGTTLRGQIFDSSKPFTLEQVLQIVKPVCSALHYAHQMGRVHCDIKPANIMVKSNGDVLVADFGIARMMENSTTTTMAGAGTPAYMAPEQVLGKNPVPQTDIYALGIVLYEMLTGGERPFTGEQAQTDGSTSEKVRWEQITLQPPSLRKYNPDISPQLEAVVSKCLQKKSEDRYADAFSLLNALSMEVKDNLREPVRAKEQEPIVSHPVEKEKIVEPYAKEKKINQHKKQTSPLVWLFGGFAVIVLGLVLGGKLSSSASPNPTLTMIITQTRLPTITFMPSATFTPSATNTPTASLTPILGIGSSMIGRDGATLVYVPAGEFIMGSDVNSNEQPIRTVYLDAFWIDQTEVTNKQYQACVDAGICKLPSATSSYSHPNYYGNPEFDNYPVVYVDWNQAASFCGWREGSLPTEAQWEKAARGTEGRTYPWGEGISCDRANYHSSCVGDTSPVGSYKNGKSPYGAYDMAGNVWEWVNDWYSETYYQSSLPSNPLGPESGQHHVNRGGSWNYNYKYARSSTRSRNFPDLTNFSFGFRCTHSVP